MATTRTTNSFSATVPQLADSANIETAFNAYHDSIASTSTGAAVLNRANTFTQAQTFSANATFSGDIAVNGGDITSTSGTLNIGQPSSTTTTVTLNLGPATPATGVTKTINIGTNGSTGSTNVVNIGPASGTLTSTINLNGKPKMYSQALNTTITAGMLEYDGDIFYATPKVNNTTAGRGLLPTQNIFKLYANNTQSVSSAGAPVTTDFYAFNKSIYLAASQAYYVDMCIRVYHNITITSGSGSITFLLKAPSSSSFEIDTQNQIDMASLATAGTPTFEFLSGLGVSKAIKSSITSSDTGYSIFRWSGFVYIGTTAGNFGPAFTLSATGSGTTCTTQMVVQAGSYCIVTPVGTYAADTNIGGWA